ncbi:hypothetical protein [Paenibacillus mesotrionivorans]|uniref:Uncharacterized protein n=1 Tax=Paenibacillus mesotrionivorans TaxID=3160968 RepID=A0ACC7NSR1_9BACL
MFDPTVFDNVKVMLEGEVYDRDLAGAIQVAAREDLVDLASLSRTFRIAFRAKPSAGLYTAWVELSSSLRNIAAEILEQSKAEAGCSLTVSFIANIPHARGAEETNPQSVCAQADAAVKAVWGGQYQLEQQVTHTYGFGKETVSHTLRLLFGRTFTEAVIDDLPELVSHTIKTLEQLS